MKKKKRLKRSLTVGKMANGTPIRKYAYGYTQKELDDNYFKLKLKYRKKLNVEKEKILFGDYAFDYFSIYKKNTRGKTQEMYLNILDNHIDDLADIKVKDITTEDIQKTINKIFDRPNVCRKTHMFIKAVFKHAHEVDHIIEFNPCVEISLPKIPRSKKNRDLHEYEREALLFADLSLKVKAYIYLASMCGLRKGEILALDKNTSFNFNTHIIHINKTREETKYIKAHIVDLTKSNASYRDVEMPKALEEVILKYIPSLESNLLFALEDGDVMTNSSHKKFMKNHVKKELNDYFNADEDIITDLCTHILRHEYSTNLFYAGVDEMEAMELMGHADISTTRKIYTHLRKNQGRSARNKLQDYTAQIKKEMKKKGIRKAC